MNNLSLKLVKMKVSVTYGHKQADPDGTGLVNGVKEKFL